MLRGSVHDAHDHRPSQTQSDTKKIPLRGERALGHTCLRSCVEGLFCTECPTCAKEGLVAYQQTMLGKTPAQNRIAIAHHEYEKIPLESQ